MNAQHRSLINAAKTTYHPNHKIEWLLWQLALALEEALMEINDLKNLALALEEALMEINDLKNIEK